MPFQEAAALVVVAVAAVYLFVKLTGWPKKRRPPGPDVKVGEKLARGIEKRKR